MKSTQDASPSERVTKIKIHKRFGKREIINQFEMSKIVKFLHTKI